MDVTSHDLSSFGVTCTFTSRFARTCSRFSRKIPTYFSVRRARLLNDNLSWPALINCQGKNGRTKMKASKSQTSSDEHGLSGNSPSKKPERFSTRLILASLAFAASGSFIVVPRPTYPHIIPLPTIDSQFRTEREDAEVARAQKVAGGSLSKTVRAVGEQVRRVGLRIAQKKRSDSRLNDSLKKDAHDLVLAGQTEALLDLRALQAELFLQAVNKWVFTKNEHIDLQELGGSFAQTAQVSWLDDEQELVLSDDALRLLFRIRWGKLTGLHRTPAFVPTLEEMRRYYGTHLLHPQAPRGDVISQTVSQISFAQALGAVDPAYPEKLTLGILRLRLGQPVRARASLRAHLEAHENGVWANIANNHLRLAEAQTSALEPAF